MAERDDLPTAVLTGRFAEAVRWASHLHADQARKGTRIAYVPHLLAVSSLVLEDGGTEEEAIAGVLHDVIEDCRVSEAEIRARSTRSSSSCRPTPRPRCSRCTYTESSTVGA